jgi:hypothetical protein
LNYSIAQSDYQITRLLDYPILKAFLHVEYRPSHDIESGSPSNLVTIVSIAVVAYAAADVVHELGHGLVAELRGVKVLSISSVAIQTDQTSRRDRLRPARAEATLHCRSLLSLAVRARQLHEQLVPRVFRPPR